MGIYGKILNEVVSNKYFSKNDFVYEDKYQVDLSKLYLLTEASPDASILDKDFKTKTGKFFNYIDIKNPKFRNYLDNDDKINGVEYNWILDNFKGCIAVDTKLDKMAGYIFVRKDNVICPIWVFDDYRGYGLGKTLLEKGINDYNADGLWVYTDNQIAIKLYEDAGFYKTNHTIKKDGNTLVLMILKK